jgi:hypothetical protein
VELFNPLWALLLGFALIVSIGWLIRRFAVSVNRRVQDAAGSWPTAQGTIEHAGPKVMGEGRTAYWVGELSYSYSVNGEYYAGVAHLPASTADAAYEATRGWKDRRVQVRVMSGKPERSVLVPNEQS